MPFSMSVVVLDLPCLFWPRFRRHRSRPNAGITVGYSRLIRCRRSRLMLPLPVDNAFSFDRHSIKNPLIYVYEPRHAHGVCEPV